MKKLFILVILVAIVFALSYFFDSSGYVLLVLPIKEHLSIEMTFWVFLGIIFIIALAGYLVYKIYALLKKILTPNLHKKELSKIEKAQSLFDKSADYFIHGDFTRAGKYLTKGLDANETTYAALNLFFVHVLNRDFAKAQNLVDNIFATDENLKLFTQSFLIFKKGSAESSDIKDIVASMKDRPDNILLTWNLFRFYKLNKNWLGVLDSLKILHKQRLLTDEQLAFETKHCLLELIYTHTNMEELADYYHAYAVKDDINLAITYARTLHKNGATAILLDFLQNFLTHKLNNELLELYGDMLTVDHAKSAINQINKWIKTHGATAELNLLLAKAYRLANDYEASLAIYLDLYKQTPNAQIAFALAELYASSSNMEKSLSFLHQAKNFLNKQT